MPLFSQTFVKEGNTGNGTSWNNAYGRLQEAIENTPAGGTIWVAAGTYIPQYTMIGSGPTSIIRSNTFHINKNLKMYGGFSGNESSLLARDIKNNPTILSGNLGSLALNTDNAYHVMVINGTVNAIDNNCLIDGFIFEEGYADGPSFPEDVAGGLYIIGEGTGAQANPSIRNCVFKDNYSRGWAGAIYADGSEGGQSNPQILQCLFFRNAARFGGAMYNFGLDGLCNPEITNCLFYGNSSEYGGGAIRNFSDGLTGTITNSIFWNNQDGITNVVGTGTNCQINYSLIDDGNPNGMVILTAGSSGSNNLDSYPEFLDTTLGNFRLKNISQAINSGSNVSLSLTTDCDQRPRKNSTIDLGPFENPWVNCPSEIVIDGFYQPLVGVFEASQRIELIKSNTSGNLILNAPEVVIGENCEFIFPVEINPTVCGL